MKSEVKSKVKSVTKSGIKSVGVKFAKIIFDTSILKQIYAADIMLQQHYLPGTVHK